MAKILTIEIDTAQIRVAEVDSRGQHIYHCFVLPVPQGAVDPYSVCQEGQDPEYHSGKCNGLFPD